MTSPLQFFLSDLISQHSSVVDVSIVVDNARFLNSKQDSRISKRSSHQSTFQHCSSEREPVGEEKSHRRWVSNEIQTEGLMLPRRQISRDSLVECKKLMESTPRWAKSPTSYSHPSSSSSTQNQSWSSIHLRRMVSGQAA